MPFATSVLEFEKEKKVDKSQRGERSFWVSEFSFISFNNEFNGPKKEPEHI